VLLIFKSNELSNFRRQTLLPLPPSQSKCTLDTVWYIDILMTGHNDASGTNPVINLLFKKTPSALDECFKLHFHTHKHAHTHVFTHTNDLVNVLYKPTLPHQDDALLCQEFHCTPKILKKLIIVYILILSLHLLT
jgi:hypothetical protein